MWHCKTNVCGHHFCAAPQRSNKGWTASVNAALRTAMAQAQAQSVKVSLSIMLQSLSLIR
jgi:hypothetical protein